MNTTVLEKIQSELERSGCDAFLLSGGDNMRYAAQVHLPFTDEHPGLAFVLFAKGRLPLVLSPSLWARSWERGIISDVRAYPGSLDATHAAAELAAFLRPLGLASIGLDMNRASVALRDALGEWAITDISAAISAIRQIKSAEEAARRQAALLLDGEVNETISQRAAKDILDRAGVRVPKESRSDVVIRFAQGAPPLGMPESAEKGKEERHGA